MNPPYVKHANSMLHDERFADVLLKAEDYEFHAHRIILASSSPVFSELLQNDSETYVTLPSETIVNGTDVEEPHESLTIIHLDDGLPHDVMTEMLRYIYTGRANSMDKLAPKMIIAAHKYELPELKRLCEKILFSKIRPNNAIEMYSLGHEVSSTVLTRKAFAVMKVNKAKMVSQSEEFRQLTSKHPSLMFELFLS
jgi:speckle-type POZ protein